MPTKIRSKPKSTAKANGTPQAASELVTAARQLGDPQLARLCKHPDQIAEKRWEREREADAKRIAVKGITEADIDDYIMRCHRESRR